MIMEAYRALGANLVNQIGKEKSGIVVFAAPDEKNEFGVCCTEPCFCYDGNGAKSTRN